jgi:hypothetical protein
MFTNVGGVNKFSLKQSEKLFIPKLRTTLAPESCKISAKRKSSTHIDSPRRKTPRTPRTPGESNSPRSSSLSGTPRSLSNSPNLSGFKFHLMKRRSTTLDSPKRTTPRTPTITPPRTPRTSRQTIHKVINRLSEELESESDEEEVENIQEELETKCTDAALIRKYLKICSQVRDNLFLGSDMVARDKETLLSNGITQ